jgi:hypothetical protein
VAAATALFGWLVQPNAAVIHYTITNATATFDEIPDSPPMPPVVDTINGSFDFDAATRTQSNVILSLTGGVDPGDYAAVFPRSASSSSTCVVCQIFAGRQPDTPMVPTSNETVTVRFAQPLDGMSTVDPVSKVLIIATGPDPCTDFPGCQSNQVSGSATTPLTRVATPEPASFAVFGPASVLCVIIWWTNRRRMTRRFPELHETRPVSEHAAGGNLTA